LNSLTLKAYADSHQVAELPIINHTTPMSTKKRGFETVRDMVISLAVLGVGVALLLLVTWRPDPPTFTPVSPEEVSQIAQQDAGFELFLPEVPANWSATTAWLEPLTSSSDHWHMSYVIDGKRYVGFEQTDGNRDLLLTSRILDFQETIKVGEFTYELFTGRNDISLVAVTELGETTLIVSLTAATDFQSVADVISASASG
jgi:hypothetical protein